MKTAYSTHFPSLPSNRNGTCERENRRIPHTHRGNKSRRAQQEDKQRLLILQLIHEKSLYEPIERETVNTEQWYGKLPNENTRFWRFDEGEVLRDPFKRGTLQNPRIMDSVETEVK